MLLVCVMLALMTSMPSRSSPLPLLSELASGPERPPRQIHNSQAAASTAAVAVTINGGMTKIQSASPPVASKTLITRVLVGYALRRQVPGVRRTPRSAARAAIVNARTSSAASCCWTAPRGRSGLLLRNTTPAMTEPQKVPPNVAASAMRGVPSSPSPKRISQATDVRRANPIVLRMILRAMDAVVSCTGLSLSMPVLARHRVIAPTIEHAAPAVPSPFG